MMRRGWTGLRLRLIVLVLLGGIPSFGMILYTAAEQRRIAAAEVQENALRMARMASATQERLIEGARQVLVLLSQLPSVREHDSARCQALLAELLGHYPLYANFGVIEQDGSMFASGVYIPEMERINLADRAYFIRTLSTGGFAMGDYQIGRITGKPTVNFGYPVRREDGSIMRVVYAALDLEWLEQLARESELPDGATLLVVDQQGIILMHFPESERWRGKSIMASSELGAIVSRREGTMRASGLDGVSRLFAFTPLKGAVGGGVVSVGVGIPERVAFAESSRMMKRNLSMLGLVALVVIGAAWVGSDVFVLRQVRALLQVIDRMRDGDLTARTGMRKGEGELNQVAKAFDDMAESVEQRIRERTRAEEALRTLNAELEQRVADRTRELDEKNRMMQSDLDLAREFQTALLPKKVAHFPPLDPEQARLRFLHQYQPSSGVGGDFYEILKVSDHEAGLLVCDVMGHGIRAALVTAIIRGLAEELRPEASDPGRFITGLHRSLTDIFRQTDTTMFATAFYMVLDLNTEQVRYTNAGSPRPLHIRTDRGCVEGFVIDDKTSGPAMGLFEDARYESGTCPIEPGDRILIYTDGLYEVSRSDGAEYGEDRLKEAVGCRLGLTADQLIDELITEVRRFSVDEEFVDDVCLVCVEVVRR